MNETLIFTENNKMYICERPSYISTGFRYSEVWEECKAVPKELKNTIPRGAAVIETVDGIQYMLWNTAGEGCGKWFTPLCDGIRFVKPERIPAGFEAGLNFIRERFPDREISIKRTKYEKRVSISVRYGDLDINDFEIVKNDVLEAMEHYEEMKAFFALDLYIKIGFKFSLCAGDADYKKYSDEEISIEDLLADRVQGDWKYIGGLGERMF